MNTVLLWIGGLLVAVLCALFAVPHFVDWTRYRGLFEEEASRILGREVRVSGAVNLRLLPTPFVRFEKLRLADAAGQTGEPFFRADDFTLWLAPAPLLRGAIEAREVELRKPVLKLRLNAEGGGNWQTLSIARGQLPFIPSDVALQSVLITDGVISVDGADGHELARVGAIKGELAVSALEGPFRFKGTYDWGGTQHELKTSTTVFDADGGLKFKAQLSVPSTANSYTFDGRLSDLSARVKVDGQLTGQLGFVPGQLDPAVAAKNSANPAADPARIPVELRAAVAANAASANLTDLSLSFEQDSKPQVISGSAQIGWRDGLEVKSDWTARWLDLDQMLGRTAATKPLETFRHLTTSLAKAVPAGGRGVATFAVDQMTLGGDAVSDASLRVERENDTLRLSHLRAGLPGGARTQISGNFPSAAVADTFDGELDVRGTNLNRLLAWAGLGPAMPEGRSDGVFTLRAKLGFGPKALEFKDASASVGAAMLAGSLSYRWSDRPRLDIVLQGDDIDLSLVSPHALDLAAVARDIVGLPVPAENSQRFKFDPQLQDATLRIRAGRLRDAERDLQDVDVDAALIGGRLTLRRLHLSSGAALDLDADGDIAGLGTRALGALRGTIAAADEPALAQLLELFGVRSDDMSFNRLKAMTPARLAWTAKFGEARGDGPGRAEFWLDGSALGRRLAGSVKLDGGLSEWRQHPLQMNLAIDRPDWARLRRLLPPDGLAPAVPSNARSAAVVGVGSARGKFLLSASGQPDQGLSTYMKLEDDAFDAGISGRVTLDASAIATAEGEMQLRTPDAAQAFVALGLSASGIPAIAVEGAADISFKDQKLKIAPSALDVAGSIVGGEVFVSQRNDRSRIEGRLTASIANIPRMLDLLSSTKNAAARNPGEIVWQADAFDFSLLDRVEGRVRLEAAQLELTSELGLQRAAIVAEFGPGRIDLETLEGDVLGGKLASRWLLEKAASGANLTGNLAVDQVRLDFLTSGRPAAAESASGLASLKATTVVGRGSSVRNLVAALTGKGEIDIARNEAGVPAPGLARRVADEVLSSKLTATLDAVEGYVLASLKAPQRAGLGTRKIGFDIGDGALKVSAFSLANDDGVATNKTTIDLSSFKIDSEWRLVERSGQPARAPGQGAARSFGALPPVTIVFAGPVSQLGRLTPVVSIEALVRELGVRRMERDVDELERLRRLDEERSKAEAERLKAMTIVSTPVIVIPPIPVPLAPAVGDATPGNAGATATDSAREAVPAVAAPAPAGEQKRRSSSGVVSEQRQVPTSQSVKKSWMKDIFRSQISGGN